MPENRFLISLPSDPARLKRFWERKFKKRKSLKFLSGLVLRQRKFRLLRLFLKPPKVCLESRTNTEPAFLLTPRIFLIVRLLFRIASAGRAFSFTASRLNSLFMTASRQTRPNFCPAIWCFPKAKSRIFTKKRQKESVMSEFILATEKSSMRQVQGVLSSSRLPNPWLLKNGVERREF